MLERLEKLHTDAAECQLIADLAATDGAKRLLFERLAEHMKAAIADIKKVLTRR
jgi:hypothetical protein